MSNTKIWLCILLFLSCLEFGPSQPSMQLTVNLLCATTLLAPHHLPLNIVESTATWCNSQLQNHLQYLLTATQILNINLWNDPTLQPIEFSLFSKSCCYPALILYFVPFPTFLSLPFPPPLPQYCPLSSSELHLFLCSCLLPAFYSFPTSLSMLALPTGGFVIEFFPLWDLGTSIFAQVFFILQFVWQNIITHSNTAHHNTTNLQTRTNVGACSHPEEHNNSIQQCTGKQLLCL